MSPRALSPILEAPARDPAVDRRTPAATSTDSPSHRRSISSGCPKTLGRDVRASVATDEATRTTTGTGAGGRVGVIAIERDHHLGGHGPRPSSSSSSSSSPPTHQFTSTPSSVNPYSNVQRTVRHPTRRSSSPTKANQSDSRTQHHHQSTTSAAMDGRKSSRPAFKWTSTDDAHLARPRDPLERREDAHRAHGRRPLGGHATSDSTDSTASSSSSTSSLSSLSSYPPLIQSPADRSTRSGAAAAASPAPSPADAGDLDRRHRHEVETDRTNDGFGWIMSSRSHRSSSSSASYVPLVAAREDEKTTTTIAGGREEGHPGRPRGASAASYISSSSTGKSERADMDMDLERQSPYGVDDDEDSGDGSRRGTTRWRWWANKLKCWTATGLWLATTVGFWIALAFWRHQVFTGLDELSTYMKEHGVAGYAMFFSLILITTFPPLPLYSTLMMLAGYTYGAFHGAVLSYASSLLGAVLVFLLFRHALPREWAACVVPPGALTRAVRAIEKRPSIFLLVRIAPYPYNVLNAVLGAGASGTGAAKGMSLARFAGTTAVSLLKVGVHTSLGSGIRSFKDLHHSGDGSGEKSKEEKEGGWGLAQVWTVVGVVLCVGLFVYLSIVARRAVDEELEGEGEDQDQDPVCREVDGQDQAYDSLLRGRALRERGATTTTTTGGGPGGSRWGYYSALPTSASVASLLSTVSGGAGGGNRSRSGSEAESQTFPAGGPLVSMRTLASSSSTAHDG